jgi:large repetitive protein
MVMREKRKSNVKTNNKLRLFLLTSILFGTLSVFAQESNCGDGIDNDGDGLIDCFDGDCANNATCVNYFIGTDKTCQIPPPKTSLFGMKLAASSANLTAMTLGVVVVGDLNRDGVPDVVTTHQGSKRVYILKGTDLTVQRSFTTIGSPEFFDHSIGNINNDNCAEIFIAESEGTDYYVTSFDCQGNQLWRVKAYDKPYDIGLADFDSDGRVELYYRNEILDARTGTIIVPGSGDWNLVDAGPVAVDVLPGNGLELVLGGEIFTVGLGARTAGAGSVTVAKRFNDLPTLGPITYFPKFNGSYVTSQTSIADFNLDGKLDIVMNGATSSSSTATTTVFFWDVTNNNFKTYQPKQLNGSSWYNGTGRVNLADIDGDGKLNATFVSGSRLFALNDDFSLKWAVTISELTSGFTSTTVFDFNNDGANEIVYRDEANLYIIDGKTGNAFATAVCKSRTANEYPIVVDADADGATEICVTCASNDGTDINVLADNVFGQVRMFKSNLDPWVPARKVWNQHAYFNVNVNDDLTIPRSQQQHQLISASGVAPCRPGQPLNTFLNQSPILDSKACPTYPSPDVAFKGPLTFTTPTCPTTNFTVSFTVENVGDLILTGNMPITFYNGDPSKPGAQKLNTQTIVLNQFKPDSLRKVVNMTVVGTGGSFTLFASLNDAGTTTPSPIAQPNTSIIECIYTNNFVSVPIVPTNFKIITEDSDQIKCGSLPANPNGTVQAYKLEGLTKVTAGYTFYWFNGATTGSISAAAFTGAQWNGLAAGTYSVFSVNNATGCRSDSEIAIVGTATKAFGATIAVNNSFTNCGTPDGRLTATPTGGAPITDYNYEWYTGAVVGTSPVLSRSNVLSGARGGTYSVLVTDKASNCNTILTATVPDVTVVPTVQVLAANVKPALCNPANSGSASADVGGVTAGFTFRWYNGGAVKPTPDFVGPTYNNLLPGSYTVVASNTATACASNSFTVVVTSTSGITVSSAVTTRQFSCNATTPNGVLTASAVNVSGVPPVGGFTYTWYTGANSVAMAVTGQTAAPGTAAQAVLSNIAAGSYTVLATNVETGCSNISTINMTDNRTTPSITSTNVSQSTCNPANGSIRATATGLPGATFNYYWYNGNIGSPTLTQVASNFFEQPAAGAASNYTALAANQYTLVAEDRATKCASNRAIITVGDATNTPTTARIRIDKVDLTSCDVTKSNARATASVTIGGTYSYRWFMGSDTTSAALPRPLATTAAITNLAAGSYTVKVTNRTSTCFGTKVVSISNNASKPSLALAKSDNSSCDPSVYLGTLKATFASNLNDPTGNLNTYVYTWKQTIGGGGPTTRTETTNQITGLNGGTYSVFVEDKTLNCISDPVSQAINNSPVPPTISVAQTGSTNCPGGAANGRVTLTVFSPNSEAPDQIGYIWYAGKTATGTPIPGETSRILERQQGGPNNYFTVLVTSEISSCDNTATVLLQDNSAAPVLTLNTATNAICTPLVSPLNYNGSVSKNRLTDNNRASGDTYTYNWYNGTGTATPYVPTPTTTGQTFSGSTALNNLNGGQQYTVTVLNDRLNCLSNPVTVTVNNNLILPDLSVTSTPNTVCPGTAANGAVQAIVTPVNGSDGYKFSWNSGVGPITEDPGSAGNNNSAIIGQSAGSYTVVATRNSTGCVKSSTISVADNSALPVLTLATIANTGCAVSTYNGIVTGTNTDVNRRNGQNYTYTLTSASPIRTAPYTVTAGAPNPPTSFGSLNAGSYTVTVRNNTLGCTSNPVTATVADATVLPAITLSSIASTNCDPLLKNGSVTVTSPNTGSTYAWFDGLTTASPILPSTSTTASALQGGSGKNYTVEVTTTATLCKKTSTLLLADNSSKPIITLATTKNKACIAPYTGEVAVTIATDVNKATGAPFDTYTYVWTPAATGTILGNKLTALPAGSYAVTATNDRLGCTSNSVNATVVDDVTYPSLTTTVDRDQTSCDPANPLGRLRVAVTNATSGQKFDYNWYKGVGTTAVNTNPLTTPLVSRDIGIASGIPPAINLTSPISTPTSGLASGDYTVNVTDNNTGCLSIKSIFLPDKITNPVVTGTPTAVTYCNIANGALAVALSSIDVNNYTLYYLHEKEDPTGFYAKTTDQAAIKTSRTAQVDVVGGIASVSGLPDPKNINMLVTTALPLKATQLIPGNYTAMVVDGITKCISAPITIAVNDDTNRSISIPGIAGASSCIANSGSITINEITPPGNDPLTGLPYNYTYQLYRGGPQNTDTNFSFMNDANVPTFLNSSSVATPHGSVSGGQNLGGSPYQGTVTNLKSPPGAPLVFPSLFIGLYTLVVKDQTGCGKVESYVVPADSAPGQIIEVSNNTKCDPLQSDGSLAVILQNPITNSLPITNFTVKLFKGLQTDNVGKPLLVNQFPAVLSFSPNILPGDSFDFGTIIDQFTGYGKILGDYIVEIEDNVSLCKTDNPISVKTLPSAPIINVDLIEANSMCDLTFADGKVTFKVNRDPNELSLKPDVTRDITVTPYVLPKYAPKLNTVYSSYPSYNLVFSGDTPVGWGGSATPVENIGLTISGFKPGNRAPIPSYKVTVTETNTGCTADQIVVIPDAPEIPGPITVAATDESFCAPTDATAGTGKVTVTAVPTGFATTDYEFSYYAFADPTLATSLYTGVGATVFDRNQAGWIEGATTGQGNTQSYYVKAVKKTGRGIGCVAPIETAVVKDVHVEPIPVLTSSPNTSCAAAFPEGFVTITTTTPGFASTYTEVFNSITNISVLESSPLNLSPLSAGTYTALITNDLTGCQVSPSVTVDDTKMPLSIISATKQDQLICNADGSITVTEIQLDQSIKGITPVTSFTASSGTSVSNGFTYSWFTGTPSGPGTLIPAVTGETLDDVNYPGPTGMKAGDYYMIATKNSGVGIPASGCETPPFLVKVNDQHLNPSVVITTFPNTSCSTSVFEGELKVKIDDATVSIPASTPYTYNYSWTTTASATPLSFSSTSNNNNGDETSAGDKDNELGLKEGDYTLVATNKQTGCSSTAIATILQNTTPVYLTSFDVTPAYYCNPSGKISLTGISYTDRTGATVTPALTEFSYNWTKGGSSIVTSPLSTSILDNSTFASIGADTYALVAKHSISPGLNCSSAPTSIVIQDQHINPEITLTPISNTACNTSYDGSIQVDVIDNSVTSLPIALPWNYNYTWASDPPTPPATPTIGNSIRDGLANLFPGLQEGTYRVTAKNNLTGCDVVGQTTILPKPASVFIDSVRVSPLVVCDGSPVAVGGNMEVIEAKYYYRSDSLTRTKLDARLSSEFSYTWYLSDKTTAVAGFSGTKLDSLLYPSIGIGKYYVTATRADATPGAGCTSDFFEVYIKDGRNYPTVSFTTSPQTICTNMDETYDGKITAKPELVVLDIKGNPLNVYGSDAYYGFNWSLPASPTGISIANTPTPARNAGSGLKSYTTAPSDIVSQGEYTLIVQNSKNRCLSEAQKVTVDKATPDIAVLDVDVKHQFDCTPFDGSLAVNGRDGKYVSLPAIASETYTFDWYNGNYTPGIPASAVPPVPTGSPFASPNSTSASPNAIVSSLGAANYHVVATKKGGKGSGCFSIPYPVVVRDSIQKPAIDTKSIANYACVAALGNGSISATVNDGTTTGTNVIEPNFSFVWAADAAGTPIKDGSGVARTDLNNSTVNNLFTGTYFVTATDQASPFKGCFNTVSGVIDFQKTEFASSFTSVAQMKCPPLEDGSLTVVEIVEEVPGLVPSKTYSMATTADRTRFDFEWFDDKSTLLTARANGAHVLGNRVAGNYFVKFTNPLGCTSSNQGGIVLDNTAKPVISLDNFTKPTVCLLPARSGSFQVSADGNLNFSDYTFQWLRGASLTDPEVLADSPDLSGIFFNDPLTYTVKVTNKATRCFSKETYKLAIDTVAIRALASAVPLSNCLSSNGVLFGATADGIGNLYRFDWYNGTTATGTPVYANEKQINTAPLGTFTVKATVPDPAFSFCPSFPATITVEDARVYPVPIIEQIAPLTFCDPAKANGVARASVAGEVRGYNFDWYEGPVTTPIIYSGAEAQGLKAVLYTAKATDIESGCFGTKTITIEDKQRVTPPPTVVVLSDRTSCVVPDGALSASVQGEVQGYTFRWSDGKTAKATPDYDKSEFYRDLDVGFYTTVAVEDSSGCVSAPAVTEIKPAQILPDFDVATKPTNCEQNMGEAKYIPLNDVLISSIVWDIGGITQVGTILSELPKGIFKVTATSDRNCVLTKSIQILPEILVFNGVSNNNDGQNEVFEIACIQDFPNNQVKIFNRQGTIVYQAKGYDNSDVAFRGISNEGISLLGTELPEGTYFYIIDKGDGSTPRSGYLELLR